MPKERLPAPRSDAPDLSYHARIGNPRTDLISENFARIERYMKRLSAWQCPSCREIHPPPHQIDTHYVSPFGFCGECWLQNENLDSLVDFDRVPLNDLRIAVERYYDDCKFYDYWPGQRNHQVEQRPFAADFLNVAYCHFGTDRVHAALSNRHPKIIVESDVRWRARFGWVPIHLWSDQEPSPPDRREWEKIFAETLVSIRPPKPSVD